MTYRHETGESLVYAVWAWILFIVAFCFKTPLRAAISGGLLLIWLYPTVSASPGREFRDSGRAYKQCQEFKKQRDLFSYGQATVDCTAERDRFRKAQKRYLKAEDR